ncbi:MAG: DUF3703 domain-containing protein [Acidimicrobiaceae bacterium]|nr:DUF3703 domain-containing protein [Acidimicrobiaceae bacterium]
MSRPPRAIQTALTDELAASQAAFDQRDAESGWLHLERAHVLSQPWAMPHIRVHSVMLRQGFKFRDRTEVAGQLVRIIVAGPGSLLGRYPEGNSGRARVSAMKPMPLEEDLAALLESAKQRPNR